MNRPLQVYLDERDLARLEAWARARGWTKSRAIRAAVRALTRLAVEFVRPEHHRAARKWLARLRDHPVSYTDAVSFAVMTARRCRTALSFDRHFQTAGFDLWRSG